MEKLELFLSDHKWFADVNPTIADLSILTNVAQIMHCGYDFTKHPNIMDWYHRCKKLRGFDENEDGARDLGNLFKSSIQEGF